MLAAPSTRTGQKRELKEWAKSHTLTCGYWEGVGEEMARVQGYPLAQPFRWPSVPFFNVEVGVIQ